MTGRCCHGLFASLYPARELCYKPDLSRGSLHPLVSSSSLPIAACQQQEKTFSSAFETVRHAVEDRAFPGAAVAVTCKSKLVALKGFGSFTYDANSPAVAADCVFDLASVSKVLATTAMAMILYERGLLELEMPLASIVPEFAGDDPRRSDVTLRLLLAHSSGLPAYEKLFLQARNKADLLQRAFSMTLSADPGAKALYSDIGFILLGVALERLADEPLDGFCQREIFGPLGMGKTMFNPPAARRERIIPTADDQTFRHRVIQGEVQDENASVLGGVAGHAGVFASAEDVAKFAHCMLQGGVPILRQETVQLFAQREKAPDGTSRALGWDTPSPPSQSGKYFSPSSYGHLGYTGTSLWIDPERQVSITLLTNRTWPDCANQAIKQVRPRVHDAIMEALEAQ